MRAVTLREDDRQGGLGGRIANGRCALQIDVGFGDAVTPEPQTAVFRRLLDDLAAPTPKVDPVCTVIAGKYRAMTILGRANTRPTLTTGRRASFSGRWIKAVSAGDHRGPASAP